MCTILLGFEDLFARAEVVVVMVVGGVETLDSELETRRGVLPGLGPGGMSWSWSVTVITKRLAVSFTKPFLFCVSEDEKAREWVAGGSVGKVAESTFCKGFVDHATGGDCAVRLG